MRIWFASGNDHKRKEMERLLGGYDLVLPKDEGIEFDPEETGRDFAENSLIKAEALWNIVHEPVLADDSGLCVKALGWGPGIYTARYGEKEAGRKLSDTLILSPYRRYMIQETCEGSIALQPSGTTGFGYDPVFRIKEIGMISADLKEGEKDLYSHRGKAARKMRILLEKEV